MRFDVMARDGQSVRYRGAPKYNGLFGRPSYIEFAEIASPTPIEWQVGDYVDYTRTGFRYKLYTIPQVAKSARSGEAGDAFVYKNVQFFCATKDLEIALFRDIVQYDNGIHFSSIPNVDTYENVYGIIDRIQANMDDFAPGQWTIRAMQTSYSEITDLMSEVREFSVSDGTCMDALNQIYAIWKGISWIYKVENGRHTIVLGRPNLQDASNTTPEFSYGDGNGLKVLTRSVSTKNELATRIYAYGSDRNMPTRYYNNLTPYIKDHESVYIPHLMLPTSDWGTTGGAKDARLAYLENASAVSKYGLIPKVMRFDGSNDLEDIYPSVEGMTVGDVADQDFPSTGWNSSDRIDEVYSAENPSDDGQYTEGSEKLKQSTTKDIDDPDKTYTTVAGQEAVTIANDSTLFTTGDTSMTSGRYSINMGGLGGSIVASGGDFAEVPKGFVEIYVGTDLEASIELSVRAGYTRMEGEYVFSVPDVSFTTEHSGIVRAYIRFEAKIPKSASSMTLAYNLEATTATINVEYSIASTFVLHVPQLGFDLNTVGTSADGLATLSMKSGACAGRDFVVKKAEYDSDTHTWDLTCQRQDDTSLMLYFPNSNSEIASGDRYVLLDIQMPSKYVTAAMTRLHNAASDALARLCKPRMVYVPEVDSKEVFLASVTLVEGLYMPIYDPDLIETFIVSEPNVNWILIDTVTIAENEDVIPVWGVTLRDEKVESMLQILTGELNATNKRLRDKDVDESRKPARDDPESILIPTVVSVKIEADRDFLTCTDDEPQTLVLTAVTQGINSPTYQWYYLGALGWVALSGETDQAYVVESDSSIYYQDDETVEDFRVVVTDGKTGDTYDDSIQITKLTNAVTIALNNPAHIFAGDEEAAQPNQSDTVGVIAFNGNTRIEATVNSITGQITGAITASVRSGTNGTTAPIIDISVTDQLTDANGVLTINVTAAGVTVDLTYSWAVAFKGGKGNSTATLYLYKRTSGDPSTTAPGNTTYTFSTDTLAPSSALNGWSRDVPSGSGPIYVTMANVVSQGNTASIAGGWTTSDPAGAWSPPTRWTGDNGYSKATITLYRKLNVGDIKDYRISNTTYNFETQELTTEQGGTLNGWAASTDDLSGSGYIYVTAVNVSSQDATVSIRGGWTTDNTVEHPEGDWSEPVRLTGDNGLIGKVMRGVNVFNADGYGLGDAQNPVNYQGRSDTDTSHIYYDVVALTDENGNIDQLYYCEHDSVVIGGTTYYAMQVSPDAGDAAAAAIWIPATNFDFVATKVLLADNAFIDVLSGNGVYLYGNSGSGVASPDIAAGMQGGSTAIWPPGSGNVVPQVNFFAGTTFQPGEDGTGYDPSDPDKVYPQTAPFRVYYDGSFVSTEGQIGGYTYNSDGLSYVYNTHQYYGYHCIYQKDAFEIETRYPAGDSRVSAFVGNGANVPVMEIVGGLTSAAALSVTGTPAISAVGDIKRDNESVITFNADASSTGYSAILHVVHCSQADYDAMESGGTLDATTFYIIS